MTAIYMRLSKEDGVSDESNSISNQRRILYQYAQEHGIIISAEYIDDGVSGTKWAREGLQELLSAAEDGWIDTILIKDLSRLSRDYIRTGELLERWFPIHGVRLISVSDQIDTSKAEMDFYSPLRAVIDDWYARDISKKVRTSIYARQSECICTAARLPYGYEKCGTIITIREDAAKIVRQIFQSFIKGSSCCTIAKELTAAGITAPAQNSSKWNDNTVRHLLNNPVYIGQLHLHTTERISYKCDKKRLLPEAEHIILDVPPIIPVEIFQKAKEYLKHRKHIRTSRHWLSGCLFCALCGNRMVLQREGDHYRAICSSRKLGNGCQNPSVQSDMLINRMKDALCEHGIRTNQMILQLLIQSATIGINQISLKLRFQPPTANELERLNHFVQERP